MEGKRPPADPRLAAVILAAGQGKRMGGMAKVLCRAGGRTLIERVVEAARGAGASRIVCVLGHQREEVAAILPAGVESVAQEERLGTGHAALQAEPLLADFPGELLVLCGDSPLVGAGTLRKLAGLVRAGPVAAAVLTFEAPAGSAYGRIIREGNCPTTEDTEGHRGQQQQAPSCSCCNKGKKQPLSSVSSASSVVGSVSGGRVLKIVEAKDAAPAELAVREVNSGSYCFRAGELFSRLHRLTNRNAQGEYYLTDVIGLLMADGLGVAALKTDDPDEALGVNDPEELAAVEAAIRRRGGAAEEA